MLGFMANSKRWQIGHVYVFACPPFAGRMSHQRAESIIARQSLWVGPIELRLRYAHVPRVLLDFLPCRVIPRRVSKDAIVEDHHDFIVGVEIAVPAAVTQQCLAERAGQGVRFLSRDTELNEGPVLWLSSIDVAGSSSADPMNGEGELDHCAELETLSKKGSPVLTTTVHVGERTLPSHECSSHRTVIATTLSRIRPHARTGVPVLALAAGGVKHSGIESAVWAFGPQTEARASPKRTTAQSGSRRGAGPLGRPAGSVLARRLADQALKCAGTGGRTWRASG